VINAAGFQFQNVADAPGHFPRMMRDKDETGAGLPDDPVHGGEQ
jgi:hypothetical protein